MSRNTRLIEAWDLYRANASLHGAGTRLPRCPICLRPMARPGVNVTPPAAVEASRGHVVPSAVGDEDRAIVPECARCNNHFGSWYDAALADQVAVDRFRSGAFDRREGIEFLSRRRRGK